MRGSPLLRALAALLVLLAAGLPLRWVTEPRARATALSADAGSITQSEVKVRVTFSHPPQRFRVSHLGEVIWSESTPGAELDRQLKLQFPKEGIELGVEASWSDSMPHAVRLQLSEPAGAQYDRTLWGSAEVDDVLTFP